MSALLTLVFYVIIVTRISSRKFAIGEFLIWILHCIWVQTLLKEIGTLSPPTSKYGVITWKYLSIFSC